MVSTPRQIPQKTVKDIIYSGIKGVLGEIPGGSTAGELLAYVVTPPLAKRMDEFLKGLASDIAELKDNVENLNTEHLANNDLFITATVQASQIALRSHQSEKVDNLRNAVLNTAIITDPKEDMVQTFLAYLDTLTVSHVKVLDYYYDPKLWGVEHNVNWPDWSMGEVLTPLKHVMPELGEEFARQIIKDLQARGLLADFNPGTTITDSGMFAGRTTEMGKDFLSFIRKPEQLSR